MTGFTLITGTEALTASGMKHNFSVRQAQLRNSKRKEQLDAALLERSNALAQSIDLSMREFAPLRLKRLLADHQVPGVANTYDGIEMWKAIMALRGKVGLTEEYIDHDREVEKMRDERLPDGCSVTDFTDLVTRLVRDHIPYSIWTGPSPAKRRRLNSSSS